MTEIIGELIRQLERPRPEAGDPLGGPPGQPDRRSPEDRLGLRQGFGEPGEEETPEPSAEGPGEPAAAPKPEILLSQARSLLTEPHPSHFGEVLVTDVWMLPKPAAARPPRPRRSWASARTGLAGEGTTWEDLRGQPAGAPVEDKTGEGEEGVDRQKRWSARQEMRQLGLLKERPALSYDARSEQYWGEAQKAARAAGRAIVDPYTHFAAGFADAQPDRIADLRAEAREYGRDAQAMLALGRAYVAIGRIKSAQSAFGAAAVADPYDREAWWHLGIAHLFTRANDKAAKELERAAELAPGDARAEMGAAVARYHLRDFGAAEDWLSRLAGSGGMRATARSLLACAMRMQGKWDQARVELRLLRQDRSGDWAAMADQCEDCVARGEQRLSAARLKRRQAIQMWKSLAATGAGGVWVVYSLAEDLFRKELRWALGPLFVLALVAGRALRGLSARELAGEFGSAEQGLPCWQATTWVNPRRSEL